MVGKRSAKSILDFVKRILCFGDSNTWGYEPGIGKRFGKDVRWTGVLRICLGDGCEIIEEGLNGRTTVYTDPLEAFKNGRDYLIPCLASHCPLNCVVLMLGTNDLKIRFELTAKEISKGAETLVRIVQSSEAGIKGRAPRVLLMAPPPIARLSGYSDMFKGAETKSREFGEHYALVAKTTGCDFLDTSRIIVSSDVDGIHLDSPEHDKLGKAVAVKIREMIG